LRGYFFIAAAGCCWGIAATLGRAAFTGRLGGGAIHAINPLVLSQSRTTITFLVLAPILLAQRGRQAFRIAPRDWWLVLALGVLGIAGSNYSYYFAIQKTNVATAITLQYTAPMLVLLYMVARGRQRPTLRRVGSVLLAVLGIALAIGIVGPGRFRLSVPGVIAAEIAALAFAYYTVAAGDLLRRYDRWQVLTLAVFGAAAFWQLVNPPWKLLAAHYNGAEWLFMLVFAMVSSLIPFSLYISGLQYLDATRAIVTSCLEPVFSIAIAAVFLGEVVKGGQLVGIAAVLAASIIVQLPEREEKSPARVLAEPIE
jgi:drug/metabolite transporter (DMT)-like permease